MSAFGKKESKIKQCLEGGEEEREVEDVEDEAGEDE